MGCFQQLKVIILNSLALYLCILHIFIATNYHNITQDLLSCGLVTQTVGKFGFTLSWRDKLTTESNLPFIQSEVEPKPIWPIVTWSLGVDYNLFTSSCDWFTGLPAAVSQLLWPATAVKMTGNSKFKNDLETTAMEAYLEFMTNYFPLPPNYFLCFALKNLFMQ